MMLTGDRSLNNTLPLRLNENDDKGKYIAIARELMAELNGWPEEVILEHWPQISAISVHLNGVCTESEHFRRELRRWHPEAEPGKFKAVLCKHGMDIWRELMIQRMLLKFPIRMLEICNDLKPSSWNSEVEKGIREYVDNFYEKKAKGEGLIIGGLHETGKTQLAVWLGDLFSGLALKIGFITAFEYFATVKAFYNNQVYNYNFEDLEIWNCHLQNLDILILDNLGENGLSEHEKKLLSSLISGFYERKKILFITTAMEIEDFKNMVGESIFSKLLEMVTPIQIMGVHYRKEMWKENK